MSLSGQLSDLSLAELIEFFCNLRKTGRLKVEYAGSTGVFYFTEGELVDAQIGSMSGAEAVYFALTLPNASFDFNTHIYPSRRSIHEPWMHLVLEGLRRVDEGIPPDKESHIDNQSPTEAADTATVSAQDENSMADVVAYMDDLCRLEDGTWAITSSIKIHEPSDAPLLPPPVAVAGAAAGGRRKMVLAGALCAFLVCATAVGALTNWFGNVRPATAVSVPVQPATQASSAAPIGTDASLPFSNGVAANTEANPPDASQPDAQITTASARNDVSSSRGANGSASSRSSGSAAAARGQNATRTPGAQTVMVQVLVDEGGRASQASVANSRPGMESYESSALRVARQRRYPAGKSGWVTVPVKIN